jgi:asparagine synthase (glutamine-hydrolysing)
MFKRNGGRVDRALLSALTQCLSYRGLDAREVWADSAIGLGHALLRTTRESGVERQPASLDGRFWITADARIDCRAELEVTLAKKDYRIRQPVPDFELILRAYAAWGEDCVDYLRGDFSFAIWDSRERKLFCARDHFGIKPFYYAEFGESWCFSNTLNCLRMHPGFSGDLNEAAIGDFLLFGVNADSGTTTFREIRRLPPAHTMTVTSEGIRVACYWSAPIDGEAHYRHSREYIEHFQVLLQDAVADRLRADRTSILLSGGLDSSSVAAVAREVASAPRADDLAAFTVTYNSGTAAEEVGLAGTTAEFLNIAHHKIPMDHLEPFDPPDDPEFAYPEPIEDAFFDGLFEQFRAISAHSRVALNGEGADNLMHFQIWPFASGLLREGNWVRLLAVSIGYLRVRRFPWRGIRYRLNRMLGRDDYEPGFPSWLAPDFVQRMNLRDRWVDWNSNRNTTTHSTSPQAHASMSLPQWQQLFEMSDPGVTRSPVEVRYPFLDLRVVNYLLSLPPFPWFYEKMLLRQAMMGKIPEAVRSRQKVAFARDPLAEKLQRFGEEFMAGGRWSEEIDGYISRGDIKTAQKKRSVDPTTVNLRPLCLNFWLQTARPLRYNIAAEARNG